MNKNTKLIIKVGAVLILGYLLIVTTIYRFKHPEMTETQLLLNFWESIKF